MKKIISILLFGILFLSGICAGSYNYKNTTEIKNKMMLTDYDMVIIAPEKFSASIQPLIDHKNSHGILTFLKTTENIYNEYGGRDKAEQIKYFIKDALEQSNISYVLLIGGRMGQLFSWYVPVRYSSVNDGNLHKQFISDLYFADIYKEGGEFEDWDSNGNGIFAEWNSDSPSPGDVMDLNPDVAVGRLPCRYKGEVNAIVDKIIYYENNAYGQDWFNNILLIGGDTNPNVGEPFPYEGEVCCEWILQYLDGFNATRLYTSDGTLTGPNDFLQAYNNGYGLVYYAGHGWQDKMGTFPPDGDEAIYFMRNENIQQLNNEHKYPVMVVGCCVTAEFDVGILNFLTVFKNLKKFNYFFNFMHELIWECIGWNFVKKPDIGSIAYIGSTSTTWGATGDKNNDSIPDGVQAGYTSGLCTEFFKLFGEDEDRFIGDIFRNTLANVIESSSADHERFQCKCVQEYTLLGDPSLKIGGYS